MLVILFVMRRFAPRLFAGDAVLMYIMWYGTVRTLLETYRVNNWTILGVPTAMWIGIIGVVLAAAWLWYRHRRGWGSPMIRPEDEPEPEPATAAAAPGAERWLSRRAVASCPTSRRPWATRRWSPSIAWRST